MNELIFQQLKIDFEDKVRQRGQQFKQKCYEPYRKGLEGAQEYALCIEERKKELQNFERRGKSKLLFMQISAKKSQEFKLIDSISAFIEEFELDRSKLGLA